jgi:Predicted dehydrogenase
VAIVGAGVIGCAVARELAGSGLRCVLIDAANDVGKGTSKANTAILHTGFDASPGSIEAKLVAGATRCLARTPSGPESQRGIRRADDRLE